MRGRSQDKGRKEGSVRSTFRQTQVKEGKRVGDRRVYRRPRLVTSLVESLLWAPGEKSFDSLEKQQEESIMENGTLYETAREEGL